LRTTSRWASSFFLGHERTEIAKAVGLEPEEQGQGRFGRDLVIVGAVFARPSVVASADASIHWSNDPGGCALRSHEHQVLEQMREARSPRGLDRDPTLYEMLTATAAANGPRSG